MFSSTEIFWIFSWWLPIFLLGLLFLPLSFIIFEKLVDHGYLFSKILSIGIVSYFLFSFSVLKILPFNVFSILFIVWIFAVINFLILKSTKKSFKDNFKWKLFIFEEMMFIVALVFWSFIRGFTPDINGLEKFMDYGFINSILRSRFMPAQDMWFPPFSINYYYFGHFVTAVLTKLSMLESKVSFNLMVATIFAFTFSFSFSIGSTLFNKIASRRSFIAGILSAIAVSFFGNLHTIYALFKAYNVENPVPFWKLQFLPQSLPNAYWYPNATRFIPFTIHEFPIYSFVVSDLHGHVLDIPFVLLAIALAYTMLSDTTSKRSDKSKGTITIRSFRISIFAFRILLIALLLAVMYMTNAWDGAIYFLLFTSIIFIKNYLLLKKSYKKINFAKFKDFVFKSLKPAAATLVLFFIFALPFNLSFKPFASGIGILCAPSFLTKLSKLGPFLFEANHCQKTPFWQLMILYGFFYFFVLAFIGFLLQRKKGKTIEDIFIISLILISTILIIIPEFIYLKDIYPAHYRANTMFKLVYQSFVMLSISSIYIVARIMSSIKTERVSRIFYVIFFPLTVLILIPPAVYPYFAIKSYYGDLKKYNGLDGTAYLKVRYPEDYDAINWINKNIKNQPVIVEAQGDSYTDYERISSNTGLPTVLGWPVHEWLWRGTYSIPAPRIEEVKDIYESQDLSLTKNLINKYKVQYVYVGDLEHQKYPSLIESKFSKFGNVVFDEKGTRIYRVNN